MIFDFISGEASTQDGGEKFAKCLAEDTDLTQKEKKSVVEKIKDFFTKLLDEQKAETAYHNDRYGNDLLFLYFASKSTAISTVTPKAFCFLLLFV